MEGAVPCRTGCREWEMRRVSLALPIGNTGFTVVRNVPAEVCIECGDTRFALATIGIVMAILKGGAAPMQQAIVPFFDYPEVV